MKRVLGLVLVLASTALLAADSARPGLDILDEGARVGNVSRLNCVGASITCSKSAQTGTLTISGAGGSVTLGSPTNGLAVDGSGNLSLGAASATNPGAVTTAAQTFAGNKTFSGDLIQNDATKKVRNSAGGLILEGNPANSAGSIAATVNTTSALTNSSAKLLSAQSAGVEKFVVWNDGSVSALGVSTSSTALAIPTNTYLDLTGGTGTRIYSDGTTVYANKPFYSFGNITSNGSVRTSGDFNNSGNNATLVFTAGQANGATAIGHKFVTSSFTTAGAKLASFVNSTTEKLYVDKDGAIYFPGIASNGTALAFPQNVQFCFDTTLGTCANYLSFNGAANQFATSFKFQTKDFTTSPSFTSIAALTVRNSWMVNDQGSQPVTANDKDGFQIRPGATLPTCAGTGATDTTNSATGGGADSTSSTTMEGTWFIVKAASSVATKRCFCQSDGAATPTYAWVNTATEAVGTSTTCP